jgi:DNA-binding CsgD family transcriptional regulator
LQNSQIFAVFSGSWEYAELRTNALDRRGALLLKDIRNMHGVPQSDQGGVKAVAPLELTPREAEVLLWISRGKSNHEIGVILGAKTGTICKHVEHIFTKLNVENRTCAAVVALETCRSVVERSQSKPDSTCAAIAGVVVMQLADLWSGACEFFDLLPSLVG